MKNESSNKSNFWVILSFIAIAGFIRVILSGVPNVAPVAAMALFGGAYFSNKKLAFVLPLLVMFFSDLGLELAYQLGLRQFSGLHAFMPFIYVGFLFVVLIGTFLKDRVRTATLIGAGLISSVIFFLISNFGVWLIGTHEYAISFAGLITCYVTALPFLRYTLIGDLFFIGVLFGAFELLKYKFPRLAFAHTTR